MLVFMPQKVVAELEKQGIDNIIAIPMFLSGAGATPSPYRKQIAAIVDQNGRAEIQ